eukprot:COSAG05_NODE_4116_length_1666_cov_1.931717_2_plen_106_part_00
MSFANAHPHAEAWAQLPSLVQDGVHYSRVALSGRGLTFLRPPDRSYNEVADKNLLTRPKGSANSKSGSSKSGRGKEEKKRKKRKSKPNPNPIDNPIDDNYAKTKV